MVHVTASVKRQETQSETGYDEIALEELVPGDVVRLSVGDMIPADLYLLEAHDLFVNQSALTGESMPAEKGCQTIHAARQTVFEANNLCFMGANVVSGYGVGLIIKTGSNSFLEVWRMTLPRCKRQQPLIGASINSPV